MCVEWSGVTCVWYAVVLTVWGPKKKGYKATKGGDWYNVGLLQGTGIRQEVQDYNAR